MSVHLMPHGAYLGHVHIGDESFWILFEDVEQIYKHLKERKKEIPPEARVFMDVYSLSTGKEMTRPHNLGGGVVNMLCLTKLSELNC